MKKVKQLKFWNGRAHGHKYRNGSFMIAAYTQKEAATLIAKAVGYEESDYTRFVSEIRNYYSPCWGNDMVDIEPTEPCLYFVESYSSKDRTPKKII